MHYEYGDEIWDGNGPTLYETNGDDPTLTDIPAVGKHKRKHRGEIGYGLALAGIATVGLIVGWVAYGLSHRPVGDAGAGPADTVTVKLPGATVTRPGRSRAVPGPTVTERLRSHVTVRATRTVPGPRTTVTACPTQFPGTYPDCQTPAWAGKASR